MTGQITDLTALELGRLIAGCQISVAEAVQAALQRITRLEPSLNAFITVDGDGALAQADAIQERLDRGEPMSLLAGVPLAVKDNISTKGLRTTCGSKMLERYVPPYEATAVERIRQAGGVILGKTNMDEFAMGSTSETSFFGPVRNPWDLQRVPGGSSGGSAAAVISGEAWYALGSDTGGSIRQPCAFCGLTGLKPTYGSVSRYGLVAFASSLDQIGPIGRTAADCAAILAQFAGADLKDSTCLPPGSNLERTSLLDMLNSAASAGSASPDLRGWKIGLPVEYFGEGLSAESRQMILAAADQLAGLGAQLVEVSLPLGDMAVPAYYLIATAEASANLARYDGIQYGYRPEGTLEDDLDDYYSKARTAGFGREVRRRILLGTFALSAGFYDAYYQKALQVRRLIGDEFGHALGQCDLILAPVSPASAPLIGASLDDPLRMYLSDIYTVTANLAGLPALSLPCGLDAQGLPVGFQLIGRAGSDGTLLRAGIAYQQVTDHHRRRPDLSKISAAGPQREMATLCDL